MNWVKDIINGHEKKEADKIKFKEEADEKRKGEKEELSKKWEIFVENIPVEILKLSEKGQCVILDKYQEG
jgi:hypothetical protein